MPGSGPGRQDTLTLRRARVTSLSDALILITDHFSLRLSFSVARAGLYTHHPVYDPPVGGPIIALQRLTICNTRDVSDDLNIYQFNSLFCFDTDGSLLHEFICKRKNSSIKSTMFAKLFGVKAPLSVCLFMHICRNVD